MSYYTGVGSRETPVEILALQSDLACILHRMGHHPRSGGAMGSDAAFEEGHCRVGHPGRMEIYLPYNGFNQRYTSHGPWWIDSVTLPNWLEAQAIAAAIHPAWDRCSDFARTAHTRNVYQVLGRSLNVPSNRLFCWAPTLTGTRVKGGTNTAVQLAHAHNVPVLNLYLDDVQQRTRDFVQNNQRLLVRGSV